MRGVKQSSLVSGIAALLLSAACTASPPDQSAGGLLAVAAGKEETAARATVTGPEDRLAVFDQNLRAALSEIIGTDYSFYGMACDFPDEPPGPNKKGEFNCDTLNPSKKDVTTINYTFIEDRKRLEALVVAWSEVESDKAAGDGSVTILLDRNVPSLDCGGIQVCVSAPWCPGPPLRCDKVKGAPCSPC